MKSATTHEIRRVLITGASGRVASRVVPFLGDRFQLKLTDLKPAAALSRFPFEPVDLMDSEQTAKIVRGSDAIVHLAVASRRNFHFSRKVMTKKDEKAENAYHLACIGVNARGTYNLFRAAKLAGVRRFVYVSSLTVVLGRASTSGFPEHEPPCPTSVYGWSKLIGEQLGELFSREHGIGVVCLRLGQPYPFGDNPREKERKFTPESRGLLLGFEDIAQAIERSLAAMHIRFGVYNIISESAWRTIDISAAARDLGYVPRLMCDAEGNMVPVSRGR